MKQTKYRIGLNSIKFDIPPKTLLFAINAEYGKTASRLIFGKKPYNKPSTGYLREKNGKQHDPLPQNIVKLFSACALLKFKSKEGHTLF